MMEDLRKFRKDFIDKVINRDLTNDTGETEYYDEFPLPDGKKHLDEFREIVRLKMDMNETDSLTQLEDILELLDEDGDIYVYLDTSLQNEIDLEQKYLMEEELNTSTTDEIRKKSIENGTLIFNSYKEDFLIAVEELDRLINTFNSSIDN